MTDSTRSQGLVVSFVTACLMTGMFVTGCGNGVDTGDADVVISDTMVDSFTTADAVDVVSTDARDAVMDVSVDTSDYTVTDEYAGDISPVDAEESDAAIDSSAPDAVTDAHDVFLDADASIPVDADDAVQPDDAEVSPETDTHEIECVTGPYCATDNDCPPFEGKHCNLALDPPQCQILYCGDVTSPCSEEAFCASRICFNDQCCQPDCDNLECGDDGCGGSCGECIGEGSYCTEGHCCIPDCGFLECGPDPICGVECGPCPDGFACTTDFRCIDVSGMAFVDAGSFWMGCNATVDSQCSDDEKPYHEVTLSAFYIDKTEVTVGMYAECVEAGFCSEPSTDYEQCSWGNEFRDDFPINCVNWDQAKDYCAWAGKRLPTEAEWEKAARGTDGRKYPWGNQTATCEYAVMYDGGGNGCGTGTPWPVCSKSPAGDSPYGLCDMSGNVWEWVSDWYDPGYYTNSPASNPTGPVSGSYRVRRGGSFAYAGNYLRASDRNYDIPSAGYDGHSLGFRCARPQ